MTRSEHIESEVHASPGRPREFDMDEALDRAIRVFRERGYHATSISTLSDAMEIATGSVYKAFKDKRAVFLAALDRYSEKRAEQVRRVLANGRPGRDRLRDLLEFYVASSCGVEGRRGCLVVGTAVELAAHDKEIAARVAVVLERNETTVRDLIRAGQDDGSIPRTVDAEATARLILCITQGMRVLGRTPRGAATAKSVVEPAMKLLA
jgi:AcrR family transcriptional regulator